jgi:L-rhamnose isomerase/sugar isomerase
MIEQQQISDYNKGKLKEHVRSLVYLTDNLHKRGIDAAEVIEKIKAFQIAIPSWALGTGGTRFGRFPMGGEPRNLEEKIEDIALLNSLNRSSDLISLHIPWDIPESVPAILSLLKKYELQVDSVNSNTFQDQDGQKHSYKFGSLCHTHKEVRQQAIAHNIEVIEYGKKLNAKSLTVWLADGSNFPGQQHFRGAFERTSDSINKIYQALPSKWTMLIEYKPFEPNFYSMVIPDWGTAYLMAKSAGERAKVLVDLGHHLPNTNIEQIVARLMQQNMLGGFHFNGSMYGDDDLTTGAIKPYQLFLIFNELADAIQGKKVKNQVPAWMIDASHNTKDPLEDLLQSVDAILIAYAQALIIERDSLLEMQQNNDAAGAQEIMQNGFRTDVRPLVREASLQKGGSVAPIKLYRELKMREKLINQRGKNSKATGL